MSWSVNASSPQIPSAPLSLRARDQLVEHLVPCSSVRPKPSSSAASHIADRVALLEQLGVSGAHRLRHDLDVACEEPGLDAEAAALEDRAAHDAPQHVAAVLVGGHDAVGDQERHRRARGRPGCAARGRLRVPRRSGRPDSSSPSAISGTNWSVSKTRRLALQDRRHPVEAQARVDVLGRQRRRATFDGVLVELHEDQVPVLEEALVVAARQVVGAAEVEAAVEVELRARAARAGRARLPEVLRARARDDALARHADRQPRLDRLLVGAEAELLVALEDRDPDVVGAEAEALERELPGELDRALA